MFARLWRHLKAPERPGAEPRIVIVVVLALFPITAVLWLLELQAGAVVAFVLLLVGLGVGTFFEFRADREQARRAKERYQHRTRESRKGGEPPSGSTG